MVVAVGFRLMTSPLSCSRPARIAAVGMVLVKVEACGKRKPSYRPNINQSPPKNFEWGIFPPASAPQRLKCQLTNGNGAHWPAAFLGLLFAHELDPHQVVASSE